VVTVLAQLTPQQSQLQAWQPARTGRIKGTVSAHAPKPIKVTTLPTGADIAWQAASLAVG